MNDVERMKAVVIDEYGTVDVLRMRDVSIPIPKNDQVLIKMYATSINPYDWKIRSGSLKERVPFRFPLILGWDAAGVIVEKGEDVRDYEIGQRVFARPRTTRFGTYSEYVATEERMLAVIPDNLTFEEAASVPLAAETAWQCLVELGKCKKGDKVLIHAGAGGVGIIALQLAKYLGAFVATTCSARNENHLYELGADLVIDYQQQKFEDVLKDYDFVLDSLGGEIQERSFQILKKGGKLISIVHMPDREKASSFGVEADFHLLKPNGDHLRILSELFGKEIIKPVISRVLDFTESDLQKAHSLSESGHTSGKIVIRIRS